MNIQNGRLTAILFFVFMFCLFFDQHKFQFGPTRDTKVILCVKFHISEISVEEMRTQHIRDHPFNLKGAGYDFFGVNIKNICFEGHFFSGIKCF